MDKKTRKELLEEYKQLKTYMGVIKITNNSNGKICVTAYPNLKNKWINLQGQLEMGMHPNLQLQKDWKDQGPDSFSYEVLEEKETEKVTDIRWELKQMEKLWVEKLQSCGDGGYNRKPEN